MSLATQIKTKLLDTQNSLTAIFNGLSDHTRQMVIDYTWPPANLCS